MPLPRPTALAALPAAVVVLLTAPPPTALPATAGQVTRGALAPELALVPLAGAFGWLCVAWLAIGAALTAGGRLPGLAGRCSSALARRVAPAVLRRAVEAAVGLSLATGVVAGSLSAHAEAPAPVPSAVPSAVPVSDLFGDPAPIDDPAPFGDPAPFDRTAARSVAAPAPTLALDGVLVVAPDAGGFLVAVPPAPEPSPSPLPHTPVARVARAPREPVDPSLLAGPRPAPEPAGEVVVRRGDTLWDIARRHLAAGATPSDVDAEWRRWYAANHALVGPDPGLIRPGQRLVPPSPRSPR